MNHLKLTFEEIMQPNILYYDKQLEEACRDICNSLRIDNMPAIDGQHFYELVNNDFHCRKIEPIHKVNKHDCIFQNPLVCQFGKNRHNVIFVLKKM